MKSKILIMFSASLFMTSCEKACQSDNGSGMSSSMAGKSGQGSIEEIRKAAQDHSLPPYIRDSAEVFQWMLEGNKKYLPNLRKAYWELSATRNDKTCKIWISMLLACEANLHKMPSREEFEEEERKRREKKLDGIESNPVRFVGSMQNCVRVLTEFDMPYADLEVAEFMRRFKQNYGDSEMGKRSEERFRTEIEQALADRKSGAVTWKFGRKSYGKEF